MRKVYSEDQAAEHGLENAANIINILLEISVTHASINLNRGVTIGNPKEEVTTTYYKYVEVLEESHSDAME